MVGSLSTNPFVPTKPSICVDFDNTCVIDDYPYYGANIGAQHVLRILQSFGHPLSLYTCRRDSKVSYDGSTLPVNPLQQALSWFRKYDLNVFVSNEPSKIYSDIYIDDRSLFTPTLQYRIKGCVHHCVDWVAVSSKLSYMGFYDFSIHRDLVFLILNDLESSNITFI